jgi:hypothetical protein
MEDLNVKLVLRVLATPVLLKHPLLELCNADHLALSFLLVEVGALPDESTVLVVLVAWNANLGANAEDEESIFEEVFEVEDGGRLVPVREGE